MRKSTLKLAIFEKIFCKNKKLTNFKLDYLTI